MPMWVEYINPFIESVDDMFNTMLGLKVVRGKVGVSVAEGDPRDLVAVVSLSSPARGAVALSFPTSTALRLVGQLLGLESRYVDDTITDGLAEVVSIVAGGAKAKLVSEDGTPIDLGLPTVLRGKAFTDLYPPKTVWLEVPFTSGMGPFALRVTFDKN